MDFHDRVSSLTHLGTAVWSVLATLVLVRLTRGHGAGRWSIALYGLSMVLLYLASGMFHGIDHGYRGSPSFLFFQKVDKSAIFLLIAGSYLPVLVYLLRGTWRLACLGLMGGIAVLGIASLWLLPTMRLEYLVFVYIGMGLIGLVALRHIAPQVGFGGLFWIALEGVFYVGGGLAEVAQWPVLVPGWFGPHEVLHVADMGGTLAHFVFVMKYVIPRPPPPAPQVLTGRITTGRNLVDLPNPVRH